MSCPFCQIDENRTRIIYKGENLTVILSNPRLVSGHLLVIPNRHIEKPSELTASEREEIFDIILKYQDLITQRISHGCDIRENYRPDVDESEIKVNHIHFHLIPRNKGDEIYERYEKIQREVFSMVSQDELDRMKDILNRE